MIGGKFSTAPILYIYLFDSVKDNR